MNWNPIKLRWNGCRWISAMLILFYIMTSNVLIISIFIYDNEYKGSETYTSIHICTFFRSLWFRDFDRICILNTIFTFATYSHLISNKFHSTNDYYSVEYPRFLDVFFFHCFSIQLRKSIIQVNEQWKMVRLANKWNERESALFFFFFVRWLHVPVWNPKWEHQTMSIEHHKGSIVSFDTQNSNSTWKDFVQRQESETYDTIWCLHQFSCAAFIWPMMNTLFSSWPKWFKNEWTFKENWFQFPTDWVLLTKPNEGNCWMKLSIGLERFRFLADDFVPTIYIQFQTHHKKSIYMRKGDRDGWRLNSLFVSLLAVHRFIQCNRHEIELPGMCSVVRSIRYWKFITTSKHVRCRVSSGWECKLEMF